MSIVGFILGLVFLSWFFFGRISGMIFFICGMAMWIGTSIYRVQSGACDKTWVLDHSMPVNIFCEVKK